MNATRTVQYIYTFDGSDLAKAREGLCLTQNELSTKSGIAQPHICAMERPAMVSIRDSTKEALERAGVKFEIKKDVMEGEIMQIVRKDGDNMR